MVGPRATHQVRAPASRTTVVLPRPAVLGLSGADTGAIGALAAPLERTFAIGNTELGLLSPLWSGWQRRCRSVRQPMLLSPRYGPRQCVVP